MPYDALPIESSRSHGHHAARDGRLCVFQVMPRGKHFGPSRATSIDLCTHDLIASSRYRASTTIITDNVNDAFPGFQIDYTEPRVHRNHANRASHIAALADTRSPDVIVVQQRLPLAAELARLLPRSKIIFHSHTVQKSFNERSGLERATRRAFRKRLYARLSGMIHVSQYCADRFSRDWPGVSVPSCSINNGLDFAAWQPAIQRTREILCVARCVPEKGVLEAAHAVAGLLPEFPDWRARFILSEVERYPNYFSAINQSLGALGAQADIAVQRPFADVKAAYERAAIALVPSRCLEAFGRTALEAHAGGAALISSGMGGLAEVSGDTALMLPEVSPDAIANAIRTFITNDSLRARLASKGNVRARTLFDIAIQSKRLDDFLLSVVKADSKLRLHASA